MVKKVKPLSAVDIDGMELSAHHNNEGLTPKEADKLLAEVRRLQVFERRWEKVLKLTRCHPMRHEFFLDLQPLPNDHGAAWDAMERAVDDDLAKEVADGKA